MCNLKYALASMCVHIFAQVNMGLCARLCVYSKVCFFAWRGSNRHIVPRELSAHLPHAFRLQRPFQCLDWGGSLADLLPARDHSRAGRTASAGFTGRWREGKNKLRLLFNLQDLATINSTFHCLFIQKLSVLVTLLLCKLLAYWMYSRPTGQSLTYVFDAKSELHCWPRAKLKRFTCCII